MIQLVLFRGDNGGHRQHLGRATDHVADGDSDVPGLLEGLEGMKVGGRRAIIIPPDKAFGPEGNPQIGLPADTDLVMVVDLARRLLTETPGARPRAFQLARGQSRPMSSTRAECVSSPTAM